MLRLVIHLLLLSILIIRPAAALAFFGDSNTRPYAALGEMTDAIAREIKADYPGRRLYLDRGDIRNDQDGSTSPFSGQLASELERSLSANAFGFEGEHLERAELAISAGYRLTADRVSVYLKLKELKKGSAYRSLKGRYEIPLDRLPGDSFKDSLDSRLQRLGARLAAGWQRAAALTVFVTPVIEARKKYSSPFSEYVTRKIRTVLPNGHTISIIEEKPAMQRLSATRSIKAASPIGATGDAAVAGANAVLEGSYLRGRDSVSLLLSLKDINGKVLANAEEQIPFELIQYSTENDAAETLAQIADTERETGGEMVTIGTTRGGAYQVFSEGETVSFRLQVRQPLFLYVYDINPDGNVSQLYPKAEEPEQPRLPGLVHMLPDANDNWAIRVEPPFGTDAVKVFASNQRLPLPIISAQMPSRSFEGKTRSLKRVDAIQNQLAAEKVINGRDLVDYYKGLARKTGAKLYESTIFIETRAAR